MGRITRFVKACSEGTGVIAGSKVRSVLELGGIKRRHCKNFGSNNPLNQVRATFKALLHLKNRQQALASARVMHDYIYHNFQIHTAPRKKVQRVGRGIGSKRGEHAAAAVKAIQPRRGYRSRDGHEGGQIPLYRKLPIRGFTRWHRFARMTSMRST